MMVRSDRPWRAAAPLATLLAALLAALPASLTAAPSATSATSATAAGAAPEPVPQAVAAEPARPADAAAAAAEPAVDPMTHLKRRLQETLGARLADDARGTHELQVPLKRPAAPTPVARAAPGSDGRAAGAGHAPASWAYDGPHGPARWGALRPGYELCARGQRQSPIDLRDGIAVDLHPVRFDYRPSRFSVIDTGHTVQVQVGAGNGIEVSGRRYELQQFHFHRPSEERIEGRQFEMSVHLVHRDAEGRLAVVAVLLERGPAQPVVQQVWNDLPLEKHVDTPGHGEIDPSGLLPADRRYYTYMGSLTTPPCSEGVLWMVMQQPVPAAPAQIDIFARLYPMNARPLQPAAGRLIKQSN
jgi:carbonic anhydrase